MQGIICPNCQSSNTVRDAELGDNIFAEVYECEDCGEMFSPDYWEAKCDK